MNKTTIYIGSNNDTHVLEIEKIKDILNMYQEGYTIIEAQEIWQGKPENTAIIEIYGDYNPVLLSELKYNLKQDSLLVADDYKKVTFI